MNQQAVRRSELCTVMQARIAMEETLSGTREMRLDSKRRMEGLRRAQRALLARAEGGIQESLDVLAGPACCVIVHRSDWLRQRLAECLASEGLTVVAEADDGADGLGIALAEVPDLVVIEDRLPSMTGEEVVTLLHELSPSTMVAAQVEGDSSVAAMLDAGAVAVFTRQVPPQQLVHQVVRQLRLSGTHLSARSKA